MWRSDVDPGLEPRKILIRRDLFTDPARGNRVVPFKFYYPAEESGPVPLVLWSHGLGGSCDGASFLARFIASHGYAVMNIQHVGTDSGLWEGKPGHPWDIIRATPIPYSATIDRFRDVPFVLDQVESWVAGQADMVKIDRARIGMSGHSFGALTTQIMAGQLFPGEDGTPLSLREKRFRAGIVYSPVPADAGAQAKTDEDNVYEPIALPLLHMTGTLDESPLGGIDYIQRQAPFERAGADGQILLVLNDGDHMVFAGSRGKLGDNPKRKLHEDIIKIVSLAYWDVHLRDDSQVRKWLTPHNLAAWLDGNGSCKFR